MLRRRKSSLWHIAGCSINGSYYYQDVADHSRCCFFSSRLRSFPAPSAGTVSFSVRRSNKDLFISKWLITSSDGYGRPHGLILTIITPQRWQGQSLFGLLYWPSRASSRAIRGGFWRCTTWGLDHEESDSAGLEWHFISFKKCIKQDTQSKSAQVSMRRSLYSECDEQTDAVSEILLSNAVLSVRSPTQSMFQ